MVQDIQTAGEDHRGGGLKRDERRHQSWAGRGQQPKWLASRLAGGKTLEDFLIG